MNKEVLPEIYQLSQSYHENGTEQLGKVLYDEQLAKKAALVGLVVGTVCFQVYLEAVKQPLQIIFQE